MASQIDENKALGALELDFPNFCKEVDFPKIDDWEKAIQNRGKSKFGPGPNEKGTQNWEGGPERDKNLWGPGPNMYISAPCLWHTKCVLV